MCSLFLYIDFKAIYFVLFGREAASVDGKMFSSPASMDLGVRLCAIPSGCGFLHVGDSLPNGRYVLIEEIYAFFV